MRGVKRGRAEEEEEEEESGASDDAGSGEGPGAESSDGDGDGDEEEDEEEEAPAPRVLPARTTRGRRVTSLVGEAAEADAQFWGQRAFEETMSDEEFSSDTEGSSDSSDTDIDAPEPEDEPAPEPSKPGSSAVRIEADDDDERSKKKRGYVDPALKMRRAVVGSTGGDVPPPKAKGGVKKAPPVKPVKPEVVPAEDALASRERRSSTVHASEFRKAVDVAMTTPPRPAPKGKANAPVAPPVVPDNRPTQRQVLLEAAHTALDNIKALEVLINQAAASAGSGAGLPRRLGAQRVRYHSKAGQLDTLTFTEVDTFPKEINSTAPPYPPRSTCVVTGLPAKYKDPLTGQPYATLAAFKELRRRHALEVQ